MYIHIHTVFFSHSPVKGHIGCFHVSSIVKNEAVNKELIFSFSLAKSPKWNFCAL